MALSSNFARVPLAFVLLFLFAGSKYYNNLWRTTIQVPEVTSNVSRVPHHVRDFSSVDPNFSFSSKTNISNFQFDVEYCRRGATLWMSFKLNKRPCLYYMRRLLLIRTEVYWHNARRLKWFKFRHLRDAALRVNSTSIRKHMRTAFLDHQCTDVALC